MCRLRRRARTVAGRVSAPAYYLETRRQCLLLLADEVMKSIAYALVASGLPLAAVSLPASYLPRLMSAICRSETMFF